MALEWWVPFQARDRGREEERRRRTQQSPTRCRVVDSEVVDDADTPGPPLVLSTLDEVIMSYNNLLCEYAALKRKEFPCEILTVTQIVVR